MNEISKEIGQSDMNVQLNQKNPFYKNRQIINIILLGALSVSLVANQFLLSKNLELSGVGNNDFLSKLTLKLNWGGSAGLTGDLGQDAVKLALASGTPEIYGNELGVDFATVEQSMNIMKEFDPTYGSKKIKFSGELLNRYIGIGTKIACEYCCGATALVKQDGEAACGCAHSQAMRGLAAYLLQNHASEYTDDKILRELARWKGSYFPKAMVDKISKQLGDGQYTADVAALLLDMKVPKYSGASSNAPSPGALPGQVGGC